MLSEAYLSFLFIQQVASLAGACHTSGTCPGHVGHLVWAPVPEQRGPWTVVHMASWVAINAWLARLLVTTCCMLLGLESGVAERSANCFDWFAGPVGADLLWKGGGLQ